MCQRHKPPPKMTNEEAQVTLRVNSAQARQDFEELEKKAEHLRGALAAAFRSGDSRSIREVNQELQRTERQMTNMRTNAANIRAAMERLDQSTPKQLKKVIADINRELNSGRVQRGSREWDEYTRSIRRAREQLQSLQAEQRATEGMFTRLNRRFNDWGTSLAASAAAFAGVVMGGKEAVQAYADMEAEEANVSKYSGLAREQVTALNEEFKAMDTRTSREQLNRLAQEAGRLGKTDPESILGYVRAADKLNVALDELGEGATLTLSKLTGIFGIEKQYGTEESLLKIGSVINDLSQSCSASAPYLVEFASRLGGVAAQAHMTSDQVLSFAAILDTQNLNVEASATVMSQLMTSLYTDTAKIAKAAGLDVKEFSQLVKTDINGALIALFEHLNSFGGMESLASIFEEMGTDGARAQPVLAALAGHIDELKQKQEEAAESFRNGTSVINEFNVQNNTVQAQLDKAKKKFTEMSVSLGQELLPVMRYAISGTSMLMKVMLTLINFFKSHKSEIIAVAAAIAAYELAVVAATVKTKLLTAAGAALNVVTKASAAAMSLWRVAAAAATNSLEFLANGFKTTAAMQLRWQTALKGLSLSSVIGAVGALASGIYILCKNLTDTFSITKMLNDLENKANDTAAESISKVKVLQANIHNANLTYDERLRAIKELEEIAPGYHATLTREGQLINENTKAVDSYIDSLLKAARVKAAQDMITEVTKEMLDAQNEMAEWGDDASGHSSSIMANILNSNIMTAPAYQSYRAAKQAQLALKVKAAEKKLQKLGEITLETDESSLFNVFQQGNSGVVALGTVSNIPVGDKPKPPSVDLKTPETSGAKAAEEAQEKAMEILEENRQTIEDNVEWERAVNAMSWNAGFKDYIEFTERRNEIDREAIEKKMSLLEKAGLTETKAYKDLAKQKESLAKESEQKVTAATLHELEKRHNADEQEAVADFSNPESSAYQNKQLLNNRLLELDVEYLTARRNLYEMGSEEWVAADDALTERIAKDSADRQKAMSDAYLQFEQDYLQASGSQREAMEIRILDELHAAGLISEEQYQQALQKIRDKYREEDKGKRQQVQSEYTDMVKNLFDSFEELFANAGKGGADFWNSLASAAQSAYAVMASIMSSFSAYSDAERDLELAKTEKRYDREIAAAGKNEKKKTELEKQKEAEVAKIKKKYNDRSMKMQLAQALAQTATAAIAAYASAASIPGSGWIIAPIAASLAVAAGMMQVATIKKQHDAQQEGYYDGGFTRRDPDSRREVGVVHANEFVANSRAVANPSIAPVLRLIDYAQRNNTVASLTAEDVSEALGLGVRVSARGMTARHGGASSQPDSAAPSQPDVMSAATVATLSQLNRRLEEGIPAYVVMDGEQGLYKKLDRYKKLIEKPAR